MGEFQSISEFRSLRRRLLLSYLGVMAVILGISAIAVYQVFSKSLYQQIDNRLLTLAETAAQNLTMVQYDYYERVERDQGFRDYQQNFRDSDDEDDHDGDLDIGLKVLHLDQSVEWFDAEGKLLDRRGRLPTKTVKLDVRHLKQGILTTRESRSLTLGVYGRGETPADRPLAGYVRVSESLESVEFVLTRLRWGLFAGGLLALGLAALGSMWLTRQSLQPIERSFRQLKQFTADASHELRSPLTAIKTSVEVMQSHPERIHPNDRKKVDAIASATAQMTHLIEDLLLLARVEGTIIKAQTEWQEVALHELLEDLSDQFEILAEKKSIALKVDVLPRVFIAGNPNHLARLFSNLLQNALQYTAAEGLVTLTLWQKDRLAWVTIADTGIGIALEDLPHVFDRFWRADKARSYREGGLGMGLAIAQSIAQAHQGEITVTSQIGVGSQFQVRLPVIG